ncbi:flagellar export chaperone FliS [Vogesella indigofera]|uniref:Flagellar secretion chaperone FliS n=1 Tax=Vogesella indigofera TaxID=45465 RepID=A0ABT5I727_VOGIN|nr:flagellar export chaperone FliS [Vogesella indigofera]MDC7691974.1 flagellar export chaperone FliS [Vogesella indigofera]
MNRLALQQLNKAYGHDALEAAVYGASPVGLIVMLYDGAITALRKAQIEIRNGNFIEKGRLLGKGLDIINGLDTVLNLEKGGEVTANLRDLYGYMKQRLGVANMKNDPAIIDEQIRLLEDLVSAWRQLEKMQEQGQAAGKV